MANYRTKVGCQTLDPIKSTLAARSLLMIFKSVLIKTVLIPRITYGFRHDNITKIKKLN